MTAVAFSSSFKRAFKKRIEGRKPLEEKFWKGLEMFKENPHDARLRTHKPSGALQEFWSFSVEYEVRVALQFVDSKRNIFEDIRNHDQVY